MVKALLVAAVSSGQGKTTVTAALARKLVKLGQRVRVFKCGPDFIDPMLLERASGAPVQSLDLWMVGKELCSRQMAQAAAEADVILIEGVMGLYDGQPSAADIAEQWNLPLMVLMTPLIPVPSATEAARSGSVLTLHSVISCACV